MPIEKPTWLRDFATAACKKMSPVSSTPELQLELLSSPGESHFKSTTTYESIEGEFDFWEQEFEGRSWHYASLGEMGRDAADLRAYDEVLRIWQRLCAIYSSSHCAGCGAHMDDNEGIEGRHSPRLHPGSLSCAQTHERLWRAAGSGALRSLGLPLPRGFVLPTISSA